MPDDQRAQFTSAPDQWEKLKPRAREMRQEPTPAEEALWQQVRNRRIHGAKFRRQHTIGHFIVDFVSIEHQLIIEVDGEIHNQADQQQYDQDRQAVLEASGFRVLRFENAAVLESVETVVKTIGEAIRGDLPHPVRPKVGTPFSIGEGEERKFQR